VYCEALWRVKKYFRIQITQGRDVAMSDYRHYLGILSGKEGKAQHRPQEVIERLRADFVLIGLHEGERIKAQVRMEVERDLSVAVAYHSRPRLKSSETT
jgi:hypothetical protein